ncbi:MAG: ATP-binding protein [Archangiaceae bacterium]|nr:ATP-binding protein [Archangiaceae bacterium]
MSAETHTLPMLLRQLKLPGFAAHYEDEARKAEKQGVTHPAFLRTLVELELSERRARRIERLRKASALPSEKTLATLKLEKLPPKVRRQLPALCEGDFVERAENLLAFGLPGRGKTHLACAIGHELVKRGHAVYFTTAVMLVQRLLAAKKALRLENELKALDAFDAVILDDIGYIQQDRDEMEVLFTFLAERYERRSVVITSNLVFSQWDRIFKDEMTTAAAIDRVVHHSIILEMSGPSVRGEAAAQREEADKKNGSPRPRREPTAFPQLFHLPRTPSTAQVRNEQEDSDQHSSIE